MPRRLAAAVVLLGALLAVPLIPVPGQARPQDNDTSGAELWQALRYRFVGPYRGGRSGAVAGVRGAPFTFFLGTPGGLYRTTSAGEVWENVSDGWFDASSIGAVAVADSDANVVYAGTGQSTIRGNVQLGAGVYRSNDGGDSWHHAGLRDAGQIARIRVHPRDPDTVYAGVIGDPFGPSATRGVYRSHDGGASWERVFFVDERTGIADLALDVNNPRVLYAAAWTVERKPWTIISGGGADGIYKSTDAGDTWTRLEGGLPGGLVGKIGLALSPADSRRLWAVVEAPPDEAGLYRSDDAGATWLKIDNDRGRRLIQRSWYYMHAVADPQDRDTLYVLNVDSFKSVDGGRTFADLDPHHGDGHDLWINPDHPNLMILGNDGGGEVSVDGGATWSSVNNQPTAEIYYVFVDEQYPYHLYGPQQDNSTLRLPSRFFGALSPEAYWQEVGGCENSQIAFDPDDPEVFYAGCYGGEASRVNVADGDWQSIMTYAQMEFGLAPKDLKHRFHWNAPMRLSRHAPGTLWFASQFVHQSTNGGRSWSIISPDLTTDDPETKETSGEPITRENDGIEVHNSLLSLEESPHRPGELWAGSDDGLVHVTRDGGRSWRNVTPPGLPEHAAVNGIEISPRDSQRVTVVARNALMQDRRPYVFRTLDGGATWRLLTDGSNGVPADEPARTLREDPEQPGLLYLGTDRGVRVSLDDGDTWQSLSLNLPPIMVTDLRVHHGDLVVSTMGRGFWILDDLTPVRQLAAARAALREQSLYLYAPRPAYRTLLSGRSGPRTRLGENPPYGAMIFYALAGTPAEELTLEIVAPDGEVLRRISSDRDLEAAPENVYMTARGETRLTRQPGLNRFVWNLRRAPVDLTDDAVIWGLTHGPRAAPGTYTARLTLGEVVQEQRFEVLADPRRETSAADYALQQQTAVAMWRDLDRLFDALRALRSVRQQARDALAVLDAARIDASDLRPRIEALAAELTAVEETIFQPLNEADQDVENFEQKVDNQLAYAYWFTDEAEHAPTQGQLERYADLRAELDAALARLQEVFAGEATALGEDLRVRGGGVIVVPPIARR